MKYTSNDILNALNRFVQNNVSGCFIGTVTSIDKVESEGIVEVEHNKLSYEVRLQAVVSDSEVGLVMTPKKGSNIFCAPEGNSSSSFIAVSFSEVDKVKLLVENSSIEVSKDKIILNGGELNGLVVVGELVKRLNAIEKAFNTLVNEFKGHNHSVTISPPATTGIIPPPAQVTIAITNVRDVENPNVKH